MASNTILLTKLDCVLVTHGWCLCCNSITVGMIFFQTTIGLQYDGHTNFQVITSSGLPCGHGKKSLLHFTKVTHKFFIRCVQTMDCKYAVVVFLLPSLFEDAQLRHAQVIVIFLRE